MRTYDFTVFLADSIPESTEGLDRLYDAGLDDASPAVCNGVSQVVFHRDAESLEDAIESSLLSLERAGLRAIRIETDDTRVIEEVNERLSAI